MDNRPDDPDELADEVRRLLIDHGAHPRDLAPLPGEDERAERRLAEILRSPRTEMPPAGSFASEPVTGRRRWMRATALIASAAAVAVALIVPWSLSGPKAAVAHPALLTFDSTSPGELPASTEPAADVLRELARRSRAGGTTSVGPVQHIVIDAWWSTHGDAGEGARSELVPVQNLVYIFPDGRMRSIERRGDPLREDGMLEDRTDWNDRPITSDETYENRDPGPAYAENLPTDPEALRKLLVSAHDARRCAPAPGGCLMDDIISLHYSYVVSPALTGALWGVIAQEPSVYLAGSTRDRLGREAIAVMTRAPDGASQQLLLADPETGAYLGEEKVLVKELDGVDFTPPAVTSFSAIVESRRIAFADVPSAP